MEKRNTPSKKLEKIKFRLKSIINLSLFYVGIKAERKWLKSEKQQPTDLME
jgi:hypothetical protein